jgi:predicted RNA-binding protein with PIN domain
VARLVLVDAYNAIYALWKEPPEDRDESRRRLVHRTEQALAKASGTHGAVGRVVLVFDTLPGAARTGMKSRHGDVSWVYAQGSADDHILDEVERREAASGGQRLLVVTNDRELAGRCRQRGAAAVGVSSFYAGTHDEEAEADTTLPPTVKGPPMTARDFGLPEGPIDLDEWTG